MCQILIISILDRIFYSNYYILTWIHISQESGKVIWYTYLFKDFPQFDVIYTVQAIRREKKQI